MRGLSSLPLQIIWLNQTKKQKTKAKKQKQKQTKKQKQSLPLLGNKVR
jgi:hypothetical protein